jgi:hypothetical protein
MPDITTESEAVALKTQRSCYVAGPMRGYPQNNFPAFHEAASILRADGWFVISPAELDLAEDEHAAHMSVEVSSTPEMLRTFVERDVSALLALRAENGDAIVLLEGWERSIGASAEVAIAKWLGLSIVHLENHNA